jgi:hypothetical protein
MLPEYNSSFTQVPVLFRYWGRGGGGERRVAGVGKVANGFIVGKKFKNFIF